MYLTSGNGKKLFIEDLKKNLTSCLNLYISVAYVSLSGLYVLLDYFKNINHIFLIVGDVTMPSCQEVFSVLFKGKDVENEKDNEKVKLLRKMITDKKLNIMFVKVENVRIIHSKVYLLEQRNGKFLGYAGSANLTYPGFYMNKEVMIRFDDYNTVNDCYIDYLTEWGNLKGKKLKIVPIKRRVKDE